MKSIFRTTIHAFTIISLCSGLYACNNNPDRIPNYTQGTGANTTGGVEKTSRGQDIFETRCAACHGRSGDAMTNGAANLRNSVLDSIGIANTIRNGRNGQMPPFTNAVLPDSDLGQVEMYIKTFRDYKK